MSSYSRVDIVEDSPVRSSSKPSCDQLVKERVDSRQRITFGSKVRGNSAVRSSVLGDKHSIARSERNDSKITDSAAAKEAKSDYYKIMKLLPGCRPISHPSLPFHQLQLPATTLRRNVPVVLQHVAKEKSKSLMSRPVQQQQQQQQQQPKSISCSGSSMQSKCK